MITGVYTPDVETVTVTGAATIVRTPFADGGHNGPACVVVADATGDGGAGTLTIEAGTWDGSTFTADQRIGFISVANGVTSSQSMLFVTKGKNATTPTIVGAFRITSVGANLKGHVRVQGKTITVP